MQHETHRVPVTALAYWKDNVILAGEGHLLKAYNIQTKTLLAAVKIFESQPIHGIVVSDYANDALVFVYGGSLACQVLIHPGPDGSFTIDRGHVQDATDWILDAASRTQAGHQIAVVTAHNALRIANLEKPPDISFQTVVEGSNCILYAANITWLSPSRCLIASGTAFGDVIIWSCSLNQVDGSFFALYQTHYTFCAHQGSVFGLQISSSEVANRIGGRRRLLATCSDDRAICLWNLSELSVESRTLTEEQRQTGFGSFASNEIHAPPVLAKVLGGHLSRVWHVRFLPLDSKEAEMPLPDQGSNIDQVSLVSFGEDACSIKWTLEENDLSPGMLPYNLKQLDSTNAHSGKNIWSVAVDQSTGTVSGAADGAVVLQPFIQANDSPTRNEISPLSIRGPHAADTCRSYAFVGPRKLLASTDHGRLLLLSIDPHLIAHEISGNVDGLEGYSVMDSCLGLAFVAGKTGLVYAYSTRSSKHYKIMDAGRKVAGIFVHKPAEHGDHDSTQNTELLVTTMGSTSATLCAIEDTNHTGDVTVRNTLDLQLPASFVVTSFAFIQQDSVELAVMGSRSGLLALFKLSGQEGDDLTSPSLVLDQVHGKESVTCLYFVADHTSCQTMMLLSTGRDGTYAAHKITWIQDEVQIITVHHLSLPFGPNVEGISISDNGHLRAWGFRSKQFIVFDIAEQQEIMTVDCGGAHRNWSFQSNANGGSFVWTKASQMYYKSQTELPFAAINSGGHGREIKATAVSPTERDLIATGAEDTDIKLSRLDDGKLKCLHTLRKHNTGIQHLQWSHDGRYLFSSGGFEEVYVWKISSGVPGLKLGVICESSHPRSGSSDLRVMSFDVQDQVSDLGLDCFQIWMAYSDSTIRLWQYGQRTWSLLSAGDYLTFCLTQCIQIGERTLLTASTDGHVAEWSINDAERTSTWNRRNKVHQSAILSMATVQLEDGSHLLLTGGDDNAIGINRRSESGDTRTLFLPSAHAAAVTGLVVVHSTSTNLWFVSASIDQRLKLWRVDTNLDGPGIDGFDVQLLKNVFTAVADVSGLEQVKLADERTGVLVCGVGMDVWKLDIDAVGPSSRTK